jgi:alanine racemase
MDQIVVSIEWDPAYSYDEVILIGEQDDLAITVQDLAEPAGSGK